MVAPNSYRLAPPGTVRRSRLIHFGMVSALAAGLSVAAVSVATLSGCRRSHDELVERDLGDVPGLRETQHRRLAKEFARLEDEKATPSLLDQYAARREYDSKDNAGAALLNLVTAKEAKQLQAQLNPLHPIRLSRNGLQQREYGGIASMHFQKIRDLHRAIALPYCRFPVHHSRGSLDDTSWVEIVASLSQLVCVDAACYVDDGEFDKAIESITASLRIAEFLAREYHLVTRVRAAQLRIDSLQLLLELAGLSEIEDPQRAQLANLIDEQLARWPDDAQAWKGERAMGMHFFELVRKGYLASLCTERELRSLGDEDSVDEIVAACRAGIDEDEYTYLIAMRDVIAACEKPYYARRNELQAIRMQLSETSDDAPIPRLTRWLLLPQLETAQEWQARDRAVCEAALLALRRSLGRQPLVKLNPLTGEPYRVSQRGGTVEVTGIESTPADRVLRLSTPARTARGASFGIED